MKLCWNIFCFLLLACMSACAPSYYATLQNPTPTNLNEQIESPSNPPKLHSTPKTPTPTDAGLSQQPIPQAIGYTHMRADGNRLVAGSGKFPDITPFDIPLPGIASWIVVIPWDEVSFWIAVLEGGQVLGFQVNSQGWKEVKIEPHNLQPGQPPLLIKESEYPNLLVAPSNFASPVTHPIPLLHTDISQVFIDINGNLIRVDPDIHEQTPIPINALPDARILSDENGRLLLLSNPTKEYDHGVLGDTIEAKSISWINDPLTGEYSVITMSDDLVIEGIAPIWADLNGDGIREIIVTASNINQGARILVFSEEGLLIATGPTIGKGYRWRHQIAVAPFGPKGELELVDVLTPHLGGVVEFFQWKGSQLKPVAQLSGFTSHVIGTRNLDLAAAGDFDGDGQVELLIPNQERSDLISIHRTKNGAEISWTLPLDNRITTNLGAVTTFDGSIAIGVGLENGILRIWHP